jgi:hypothetical protein
VFRLLALRVNPPHLGGEELAANARICDRLHHSNRPAPDRVRALPDWVFRSSLLRLATFPERPFHPNFPPSLARRFVQRPISHPSCLSLKEPVHQLLKACRCRRILARVVTSRQSRLPRVRPPRPQHPQLDYWTRPPYLDLQASALSTSL